MLFEEVDAKAILNTPTPYATLFDDNKVIWRLSKDGMFFVYQLIPSSGETYVDSDQLAIPSEWSSIWKLCIPPPPPKAEGLYMASL